MTLDRQTKAKFIYDALSAMLFAMALLFCALASITPAGLDVLLAGLVLGLSIWFGYGIRPGVELWLEGVSSTKEFVFQSSLALVFMFVFVGLIALYFCMSFMMGL